MCCSLLFLLSASLVQANDDPIGAKVETARQRYQETLDQVKEDVTQYLDRREEIARRTGNFELLSEIQQARTKFESTGTVPDMAPVIYYRRACSAHDAYETACEMAIKAYTQAGQEKEAEQLSQFLEKLWRIGLERSTRFSGEVRITSKNEVGYDIGEVGKNDRIRLSYVKGKWKGWGNLASDSPDDVKLEKGNRNRLVICQVAPNGRTRVLAIVPPGTRYQTFEWVANRNYDRIALRINDNDNDFASNPDGGVTYQLDVLRGY